MTASAKRGFDAVLRYLEDELSFATSHYNESYLDRRISARLRRTGAETYDEYLERLVADPTEHEALLNSLSINVTSFFRNPEVWERLRPILRETTQERRRVRLWSAGCSDGREPYSLAMLALDDAGTAAERIDITATDISEDVLSAARRAVYEPTRTTDIAAELDVIDRSSEYVARNDDRFEVRPAVKDRVTFERHDLIRGDPPGEFDFVMCRNLFIYIAVEYKAPIIETITGALRDGGYLVIGMAETLPPEFKPTYESIDKRCRIYRKLG